MKSLADEEFWNSNEVRAHIARTFLSFEQDITKNPESDIWDYSSEIIECFQESTPLGVSTILLPHFLNLAENASSKQKLQILTLLCNWLATSQWLSLSDESVYFSKRKFLAEFKQALDSNLLNLDHSGDRVSFFKGMSVVCGDLPLAFKLLDLENELLS